MHTPDHSHKKLASTDRRLAHLLLALEPLAFESQAARAALADCRRIEQLLGRPATEIVAHEADLLRMLARVDFVAHRLSKKRLQNVMSNLRRAFQLVSWSTPRNSKAMSPAWKDLCQLMRYDFDRSTVGSLGRFCTERGLDPEAVTSDVVEAHRLHMVEIDYHRNPHVAFRRLCHAWNSMRGQPGWPELRLVPPNRSRYWGLKWAEFPPSLVAEKDAWLTAYSGKAEPGDGGAKRSRFANIAVKPKSVLSIRDRDHALRTWASAMVRKGIDPRSLTGLRDLVTEAAFEAALDYLEDGKRKKETIYHLAYVPLILARHYLQLPSAELTRLEHCVRELRPVRQDDRLTEKVEMVLEELEDPVRRRRLLALPWLVLRQLDAVLAPGIKEAWRMQTAVALALLQRTALRRANVAALHWDANFRGLDGSGPVRLVIEGSQVKNGRALGFELGERVVELLTLYRERYWPLLAPPGSQYLFPGRFRSSLDPNQFSNRVSKFILDEVGLKMTPHMFRHLAVDIIQSADPRDQETGRLLLGHSTDATTRKHYQRKRHRQNYAAFDALVDNIAQGATAELGGTR